MKTRAAIQKQAIRLFQDQGYSATTIEQIADAAEISPSTLFRYFPTKESILLEDDYDPIIFQGFMNQPTEVNPVTAFRRSIAVASANFTDEERNAFRERMCLVLSIPELQAAFLRHLFEGMDQIVAMLAERSDQPGSMLPFYTIAGAIIGVVFSAAHYCTLNPEADIFRTIDESLAQLESCQEY